ncbi:uncharacterized protein LOC495453 isoform X13 [Xenopus laevis]|uniref:Uncharacterized protein LOC495453 isoform X13 n=1 Tax=Xenopus laevis TaxID=8355 RepID=A0A8J1KW11_XENLA|nr:uncharacterized protein LOC495453 isoform X13 [Xenopus laevis]
MNSRSTIKRESDSVLGAGFPEAEQLQIKIVKQEPDNYQRGTRSSSVPQIPGFPLSDPEESRVRIKEEVLDPSYNEDAMDDTVISFTVGETDPQTLQMKEEDEGAASGSYQEDTSTPFAEGGFLLAGQEIYQTKIKDEPDPEFYPNPRDISVAPLPDGGTFTEGKMENEHMDTEDPLSTIRSEIVTFPVPERRPTVHQDIMCKQRRLSYNISFKLEVVSYAKEHGNRAAARHFGPPPTEKMIREWRKQEEQLQKTEKNKCTLRGHVAKWPQLDEEMKNWIMQHQNTCSEHKSEKEPNCTSCCAKGS